MKIASLIFFFLCFAVHSAGATYEEMLNGMVWVADTTEIPQGFETKGHGTGFLVDLNNCIFVTARHVADVANPQYLSVAFSDEKWLQIKQVFRAPGGRDLAFLKADCSEEVRKEKYAFPVSKSPLTLKAVGTQILMIGYPIIDGVDMSHLPVMRTGIIAAYDSLFLPPLILDFPAANGFSGSPVVRQDTGEVIAVAIRAGNNFINGFTFAEPLTMRDYQNAVKER